MLIIIILVQTKNICIVSIVLCSHIFVGYSILSSNIRHYYILQIVINILYSPNEYFIVIFIFCLCLYLI